MMPRFLLVLCFMSATTFAEDFAWLAEVQHAPASSPVPSRHLTPLLSGEDLQSPDPVSRWKSRRLQLLREWQAVLGPMPDRPSSNAIEVLRTEQLEHVTRRQIRYENEPGQYLEAYLLEPLNNKPEERRPGLIALHATTPLTNEPIAGVAGRDDEQLV